MMSGFDQTFFIHLLLQGLAAFFAICGFAMVLDMPQKFVGWAGVSGFIGWVVYLLVAACGVTKVGAAFCSSFAVVLTSYVMARKLKAPVTVFFVAGILPTVPGASIYRVVFFLIDGKTSLAQFYLVETIQIAGAMALAIFIVDSMNKIYYGNKSQKAKSIEKKVP